MDEEKFQKTFTEREIKFHITSTVRTASNFLTAKPGAGPTPEVLWHPLHSEQKRQKQNMSVWDAEAWGARGPTRAESPPPSAATG